MLPGLLSTISDGLTITLRGMPETQTPPVTPPTSPPPDPKAAPDIKTLVQQELDRKAAEQKEAERLREPPKDFGEFVDKLSGSLVPKVADEVMKRLGLDDEGEPKPPTGPPAKGGFDFMKWFTGNK